MYALHIVQRETVLSVTLLSNSEAPLKGASRLLKAGVNERDYVREKYKDDTSSFEFDKFLSMKILLHSLMARKFIEGNFVAQQDADYEHIANSEHKVLMRASLSSALEH